VDSYKEQGYLPEAINNYIVRLGWSHGDQEIFTPAELIEKFDLKDVNRSEGALNMEKMEWINQQHIQNSESEKLAPLLIPFLQKAGVTITEQNPRLIPAIDTMKARAKTLVELAEISAFYFVDDNKLTYDNAAAKKFLNEKTRPLLTALAKKLSEIETWQKEQIEQTVKNFIKQNEIKLKDLAQPCRVALVGRAKGPGLYETMEVLGRASSVTRLKRAEKR
jgi:glutamyl-tRNA synthetase